MLGIIRVLTTDQDEILQEHGRTMNEKFNIESLTHCIPDQPNGIYDDTSEQTAVPKIVSLAQKMAENKNVQALTISCAADPALDEVRGVVDIPVLGAGVCGAHAASMVSERVGIIGIKEAPPPRMRKELGDRFYSFAYSPKLRKTTDLLEEGAKEELLSIVKRLIGEGADSILFACTGFSTIRLKDYLVKYIDVPIIDLVEAQAIAYNLICGKI